MRAALMSIGDGTIIIGGLRGQKFDVCISCHANKILTSSPSHIYSPSSYRHLPSGILPQSAIFPHHVRKSRGRGYKELFVTTKSWELRLISSFCLLLTIRVYAHIAVDETLVWWNPWTLFSTFWMLIDSRGILYFLDILRNEHLLDTRKFINSRLTVVFVQKKNVVRFLIFPWPLSWKFNCNGTDVRNLLGP